MLKLKLKPSGELGLQEIQCYNVSVSPDLSHITGRTSNYNSLLNGELVKVVNNKNKFINSCKVDTENVKVQGRVLLEITLPIKSVTKSLLLPSSSTYTLSSITKNYVEYNGAFSYDYNGSYLVDGKVYTADSTTSAVTISTFAYIEDGKVMIGDKEYYADFRGGEGKPDIKESKYGTALNVDDKIGNITFKGVRQYSPDYWTRETKFSIWKDENKTLDVETTLYGAYEHYIYYDGEQYYLKSMYDASKQYKGYGVEINGQYYSAITRSTYDGEINVPNDYGEPFIGSLIRIYPTDVDIAQNPEVYYEIQDALVSPKNGGRFLFLVTKSESLDLKPGDVVVAKSNGAIESKIYVQSDGANKYIEYLGKKYDVIDGTYTYITIGDEKGEYEYRLMEDSDGEYYAVINGNKVYYTLSNNKCSAMASNKIYYTKTEKSSVKTGGRENVFYGVSSFDDTENYNKISATTVSGVSVNGETYRVYPDVDNVNSYVIINEYMEYSLVISEKTGSSTYLCYPYVEMSEMDYVDLYVNSGGTKYILTPEDISGHTFIADDGKMYFRSIDYPVYETNNKETVANFQRSVCDALVWNNDKFTYQVRNDIFGEKKIYSDTYLYEATISTKPFCTTDALNLSIFKVNKYANLKIPIVNGTFNDIMTDDVAASILSKEMIDRKKGKVVDMEKDIYYPVWKAYVIVYYADTKLNIDLSKFVHEPKKHTFADGVGKLVFGQPVTIIDNETFMNKTGLTCIFLPDSIEEIGDRVFSGCTSLTGLTCDATVPPTLGDDVFDGVPNDFEINVPSGNIDDYKNAEGWSNYNDNISPIVIETTDKVVYEPITNIRFNLHFRTRQLDNWKVIEDYNEDVDKDLCNWVITDYKYYQEALNMAGGINRTLQNASDLIGFMNFTTSEVKNMSNKIAKSFLRLSFYSTDNPQTQVLLSTSTIFMDENEMLQRYMSGQRGTKIGSFIKTKLYQKEVSYTSSTIGDDTEYVGTSSSRYDFETNEPLRLSSRLNVYDKHVAKNSSEGFYFYMFREYANNMRPLTIYLKIDFNHAGIGRTIQFMLPRGEDGNPLYIHNPNDLKILKKGFTLKDIYKQIYIPINVIYDDKTNRYVYYLPKELRENGELGVDDDIMEFNLFEVKFKDESVNRDNEGNQ